MDRLNQLRGEAGTSRDSALDTSSLSSEAFITASETTSKYFSFSEEDSTFDVSPIKDVSSNIDVEKNVSESDRLISNLSPIAKKNDFLDSYKIGKQIEAANILSGGVDIFEDNDNSYDGDELVIDDNADGEDKSNPGMKLPDLKEEQVNDATLPEADPAPRKDTTEVILHIDGKNVDAIDIGNGLYLYRREGEDELAAVQIDEDRQQPSYKFLKVRENDEGNLEVYEEIQIEVPKEAPVLDGKLCEANVSHVPINDISDVTSSKVPERKNKAQSETLATATSNIDKDSNKDIDSKSEINGKLMKFCESRKSPVVGSFTPMAYHSTPNKEGIPLTKTMVDMQLHPNRHSDNVKKTIEVHTDSIKPKFNQLNETIKDSEDKICLDESNIDSKKKCGILELGSEDKEKTIATVERDKIKEIATDVKIGSGENEETKKEDKLPSCLTENATKNEIKKVEPKSTETSPKPILVISKSSDEPGVLEIAATENLCKDSKLVGDVCKYDVRDSILEIDKNDLAHEKKLTSNKTINLESGVEPIILQDECESICRNKQDNTKITYVNNDETDTSDISLTGLDNNQDIQQSKVIYPATVEGRDKKDNNTEQNMKENTVTDEKNDSRPVKAEKEILIQTSNEKTKEKKLTTGVPTIAVVNENINKDQPFLLKTDTQSNNKNENDSKPDDKKLDLEKIKDIVENENLVHMDIKDSNVADLTTINSVEKALFTKKMDSQTIPGVPVVDNKKKKEIDTKDLKSILVQNTTKNKESTIAKKTLPKVVAITEQKPISNNHAPVPFGKWTEANRQAFLNKIKETKVPSNSSNGKQIKNSNDLNRRDVLKKIDSHRQIHTNISTAKIQDFGSSNRLPVKKEASVFTSKPVPQESKVPVKTEPSLLQANSGTNKKIVKQETISKLQTNSANLAIVSTTVSKKEPAQRKEINNQDLIDKTIEDIINRALPVKSQHDNGQDVMTETLEALQSNETFDEIEKRMNELHGVGFSERANHSQLHQPEQKSSQKLDMQKVACQKPSKIPNLLPFTHKSQRKDIKENVIDIDSEEEIIEHEPITGDMDLNKKHISKLSEKFTDKHEPITRQNTDNSKKEAIITEKDFDKFVRRNSISYENCITVNFDVKEPHNVVQTIVQKDTILSTITKQDHLDNNTALKYETQKPIIVTKLAQDTYKAITQNEDEKVTNKNYQAKVKMAYQTAMTAKRHLEHPITIIEDKPVKVVFMDTSAEFIPKQLNAHGKELSPAKKQISSIDLCTINTSDSLDSDILELEDGKSAETKSKTKHQRKQVLTPVETPELELIEPDDLGIEVSPKKKRKTEERIENSPKPVVPKKTYLLGRGPKNEDEITKTLEVTKTVEAEPLKLETSRISHNNTASAIDNLVKAAELLETQSENLSKVSLVEHNTDSQQNTPVKRGRGRPRKYPLPEGNVSTTKVPPPQKKPRLSDVEMIKNKNSDYDDDDDSSDGEIIRENWTMGKINENIVCPICNKLFRSENVVFKHVKHCTGPSPNRSDSGNRSPRRFRESQDSESKSGDGKLDEIETCDKEIVQKDIRKKRKSRETSFKSNAIDEESILIEDVVSKTKADISEERKSESRKSAQSKSNISGNKVNNLICEFCGKTFRQLSYLANHKLQHEKVESKNLKGDVKSSKPVFCCEVCKKEFRKLHHLVQHRFIHNPSGALSSKLLRKNSAEQNENRAFKEQDVSKPVDDTSAGFRCEPCDKSFRKLHHLVEHRETHDGINRQKNTTTVTAPMEKAPPPPQCEICKKTFRKLHHLIEHKEQHVESSSEKLEEKNIKSSLSTKDIIHECPLCYMVFPNEHSLNKHTIICQRKKRQSASKQNKQIKDLENVEENTLMDKPDDDLEQDNEVIIVSTEIITVNKDVQNVALEEAHKQKENKTDVSLVVANTIILPPEPPSHSDITENTKELSTDLIKEPERDIAKVIPNLPDNLKQFEERESSNFEDTLKKKSDKAPHTATNKTKPNRSISNNDDTQSIEISDDDDDEIRYMFNPNYKIEDNAKLFMKIKANKRNSLKIARPNSKNPVKSQISLQHPAKIPRLKSKLVQSKATNGMTLTKNIPKTSALELSTDSDSDNDIKYSFPKISKSNAEEQKSKDTDKNFHRKSATVKRKSLSTIAKRKSLGKVTGAKHKAQPSAVKKRIAEAGHRCDCGQLFSSAALLSRHTSLAHTPPRIRRRRSPPPAPSLPVPKQHTTKPVADPKPKQHIAKPVADPKPKQHTAKPVADPKPKVSTTRNSSVRSEADPDVRQTAARSQRTDSKKSDTRTSVKAGEPTKSGVKNRKIRSSVAHRGVPPPEKMQKLMEHFKK